jgi:hypothetical protein
VAVGLAGDLAGDIMDEPEVSGQPRWSVHLLEQVRRHLWQ